MTLKELLQRAIDIANQGLTEASHTEQAAEAHLPMVFRAVGERAAAVPRLRTTLRRTKTLNVVNGSVALPTDVLTSYLDEATLQDSSDLTKFYSLAPWDQLVAGQLDQRLGHFAIEGEGTLQVVEPGAVYVPAAGATISLLLTVPCIPAIPALVTDQIAIIAEITDELLTALVAALRRSA